LIPLKARRKKKSSQKSQTKVTGRELQSSLISIAIFNGVIMKFKVAILSLKDKI
jgi:hypothetical protein